MKKFLIFSSLIVLVAAGAILYLHMKPERPAAQIAKVIPQSHSAANLTPAATLYFDKYGFDQNILEVAVGTHITVKNISSTAVDFEALPGQPDQNEDLDLGTINAGDAKSFTVARSGVWQYQGNGNPQLRGSITTAQKSSYDPSLTPDAHVSAHVFNIVYDDYGFAPNEITVPVGTTIALKNVTDDTQPGVSHFAESTHDTSRNPALDIGELQKQQVKTFTLTAKGSWELENIDQPTEKALMRITAQ